MYIEYIGIPVCSFLIKIRRNFGAKFYQKHSLINAVGIPVGNNLNFLELEKMYITVNQYFINLINMYFLNTAYKAVQILSVSLFEKKPINQLFQHTQVQYFKELNSNQLNLFDL
jgi:hypothetical protein